MRKREDNSHTRGIKEVRSESMKEVKTSAQDFEVGSVHEGKVVKILQFGAFVNLNGTDGLVHISELQHKRTANVEDVLKVGDVVNVKVLPYDDRGRLRLSIKALQPAPERGDKGDERGR